MKNLLALTVAAAALAPAALAAQPALAIPVAAPAIVAPAPVQQTPITVDSSQKAPGGVADSALEAKVKLVATQLRCPICQGLSLEDSPSGLAQEMRGMIRQQLSEGRTPAQVKAFFVSKYGEWILLEPKARGFNLAVYLLPLLAVLGGVYIIVRSVRRWSARTAEAEADEEPAEEKPTPAGTPADR